MTDPLNYFLVILGGFAVVWSFRNSSGHNGKKIGEFEYAAFSAIWGIPLFFLVIPNMSKAYPDIYKILDAVPMIGTPLLFAFGLALGFLGGWLFKLIWKGK